MKTAASESAGSPLTKGFNASMPPEDALIRVRSQWVAAGTFASGFVIETVVRTNGSKAPAVKFQYTPLPPMSKADGWHSCRGDPLWSPQIAIRALLQHRHIP